MELQTFDSVEDTQDVANGQVPPAKEASSPQAVPDESDEETGRTGITPQQKATLAGTVLATLTNMLAYSVIVVFYPIEAKAKGTSQAVIGMVFGAFSVAYSIGSPITGKILPTIGPRFVLLASSFITGGSNSLFGYIIDMPTQATFTAFSFLIRIVEGLGSAATITASAAILASVFPDDIGKAVSVVEMMVGFSFAIGPAVGGLMYDAAGFRIPFFVLGGLVLFTVPVNYFILPDDHGNEAEESGSMRGVLSIPAVWVALFTNFIGFGATAYVQPTLAIFLDELQLSVMAISVLFVCMGLGYGIFSLLWGAIADAKKCARIIMITGAFTSGVLFLILALPLVLQLPVTGVLPGITVPIASATLSMMGTPTLIDMLCSAEWYGLPSGIGTTAVVTGLWNSAFAIGTMTGPLLGGAITQYYGFDYSMLILACTLFVVTVITGLFGLWEFRCGKGRREPTEASSSDRTRLLSSQ